MGSAWLREDDDTWGLQRRMESTRQTFRGAAAHAGCCLGSHSSPREDATAFNDPRGTEGRAQAASGSLGNWRGCPGVSPFCFQLGMSWWRIFPSKRRIIGSSPAPPPLPPTLSTHSPPVLWATLVSSLGLSSCTQLTWSSQIWPIQTSRGTLCFCHSASRNMILSNTGKMDLSCLLP